MKKIRQTLNLSVSVPLAALALTACQPAQLIAHNQEAPTAITQVQQAPRLAAGTFEGMVANFDGAKFVPVADALVTLVGTNFVAHTDSNGRYSVAGVAPGTYKVSASKDGMTSGSHDIVMNAVMGTPRVNMALQAPQRTLQAVPNAATVTVSGVVTDPRGSALPNAAVKVLCNTGGPASAGFNSGRDITPALTSDAAGFYTVAIPNVIISPTQPGQVQVTSNGASPGGVKLETTDVYAYTLTNTTLVANPQCKAFTQPGTPTFPGGSFGAMGTQSTIQATWLSSRTDEFYVELWCNGSAGNVAQTYGVLPDSIANTTPALPAAPFGVATYRIPFTMPGPTFQARIVPFGLASQFGKGSPGGGNPAAVSFVTNYPLGTDLLTANTFEADVSFLGNSIVNGTTNTGINGAPNLFVSADTVTYKVSLLNLNTNVSQDIALSGVVPIGSTNITATVQTYVDPAGATPPTIPSPPGGTPAAVAIAAGAITQPDATGKWTIAGFNLPTAVVVPGPVTNRGRADLVISFIAPPTMGRGFSYGITGLSTKMVSANLVKLLSNPLPSTTLTSSGIDTAAIAFTTPKSYGAAGAAGTADVKFVITPTNSNSVGAIRFTDRSATNSPVGSNATLNGTLAQPAAGTTMGFSPGDHIDLVIDGVAQPSTTILSNWDLETLTAFLNLQFPSITASRSGSNFIKIVRNAQGTAKTLQIAASSSGTVSSKLGLAPGGPAVGGTNGASADFTPGAPAGTLAFASQPGGTIWTFNATSSVQNGDGSVSAGFTINPPNAFVGGDTYTTPITVQYRIVQSGGVATLFGGTAGAGPGLLAPFGTALTVVNTSPNSTDPTRDQAVNKVIADANGAGPF